MAFCLFRQATTDAIIFGCTPKSCFLHPIISHFHNILRIYAKVDTCDWIETF